MASVAHPSAFHWAAAQTQPLASDNETSSFWGAAAIGTLGAMPIYVRPRSIVIEIVNTTTDYQEYQAAEPAPDEK